jgi:hypothetical protein
MARLSLSPILWGHWKGLSQRTYAGEDLVGVTPDYVSRSLVILLPLGAAAIVSWAPIRPTLSFESVVGLSLAWSALVSAGLIGTFAVLAGWRARLNERAKTDRYYRSVEKPVAALVDEAVAHTLMGVIDALLLALLAAGSAAFPSPLHRYVLALAIMFATHAALLFVIISTRLYSAYVQVEQVATAVNGFDGSETGTQ